jgi:hypothetical protein
MLRPLTHGSRWRTWSAARSRFANTRSCERKKTSKPRPPCWQSGRRPRTLLLQLKWISRPALQRRLSQELEMVMLLQLTVQTPPAVMMSVYRRGSSRRLPPSVLPSRHRSGNGFLIYGKFANRSNQFRTFFFGPNPFKAQLMRVVGTLLAGATSQRPVGARTRGFVCVKAREEIFHT